MDRHELSLAGARLTLLPSRVLWWAEASLLAAGDLHLGRAERVARNGRGLLPPYETADTLDRLEREVARLRPSTLVLLGDSFDDMAASNALAPDIGERLSRVADGRRLVWIAGNHDPAPAALPGTHWEEWREGPLVFRHIPRPGATPGEVSGHFHPKARICLRGQPIARPCFLADAHRLILPAFGTYTGGLDVRDPAFDALLAPEATAFLTGRSITPLPRRRFVRGTA